MIAFAAVALIALSLAAPAVAAEPYPYPYPPPPTEEPDPAPGDPYPPAPPSGDPYPAPSPPSPEPSPDPPSAPKPVRVKQTVIDGRTILTNSRGRTLYSLSAERGGRFICTSAACLTAWKPLRIAAGAKPLGPVKLDTVERPEGGSQVTFRGRPLYTFAADRKRGDAKGDGIRDVGVWRPATAGKARR